MSNTLKNLSSIQPVDISGDTVVVPYSADVVIEDVVIVVAADDPEDVTVVTVDTSVFVSDVAVDSVVCELVKDAALVVWVLSGDLVVLLSTAFFSPKTEKTHTF